MNEKNSDRVICSILKKRDFKQSPRLPFNFYTTNFDTALADAYAIARILYPAGVNQSAKHGEKLADKGVFCLIDI